MQPRKVVVGVVLALVAIIGVVALVKYFPSHEIVFQQVGASACPFYGEPWSVTIGDETKVQPAGAVVDPNGLKSTNDPTVTTIIFLVPDGTYKYVVRPNAFFFTPSTGVVTVNGSDVHVQITYAGHGCTTRTSTLTQT